jgi:hypothetical protein
MREETRQTLWRSLVWSGVLAAAYLTAALYAAGHGMSLDLGGALPAAPLVFPLMLDLFTLHLLMPVHRLFLGEVREIPVSLIAIRSVLIGLMWGLGFLWPHLAYRKTRAKPFLVWQCAFVGWSIASVGLTVGLLIWAFSDMD